MNVYRSVARARRQLLLGCLMVLATSGLLNAALVSGESSLEHIRRLQGLNKPTAGNPVLEVRVHKVGNIQLCVTNYGIFGNQADASIIDPETGLSAPSCVYPAGSGIEYLFQGALWIGAIVNEDTLVSHGHDGWQHIFEFYADAAPKGSMIKRTIRKSEPEYSPDAVSEADYIAVYTDTLTDQAFVQQNPDEGRPHIPINVQITQKSYAWSYSYAEDFILIDFLIRNIGVSEIKKCYMGIYVDADVGHQPTNNDFFQDDICGFRSTVPSPACPDLEDIINVAWIADNDGDPVGGVFNKYSPTAVTGTRVVRTPNPELKTSFNWWVSQGDASLDWGPIRQENNRGLGTGGLGTPAGDENKYFFMKNGEFDYDQLYSAIDYSSAGWLPPAQSISSDLADGYDTRYLLSFGPFDITPGDSLPITMAYVAGDKFHVRPDDFKANFDANNPDKVAAVLDFSDLATNAQWAGWVYDNPGVDTDSNGVKVIPGVEDPIINPCTGKEIYRFGDGVPDFSGPPPPSPPQLRFSASPGRVELRWNGKDSEEGQDPFSFLKDFEGYRVYMGNQLLLSEFALLTSYDFEDFNRYRHNRSFDPPRWELTEVPFTLDSLRKLYGENFDPGRYPNAADSLEVPGENVAYYFTPQDYNRQVLGEPGSIAKRFPDAQKGDMIWEPELNDSVDAYYEYVYIIDGLLPSRPVYFAVTTFDFGNPLTSLAALESSPLANAIEVYPVNSTDRVETEKLEVTVFPNPYRIDGGYLEAGYESLNAQASSPERARRLHFANLPSAATIRIYTLDGDMVREMQHPCDCPLQE
ncbi:MAG: hypothetical protein IT585_04090, partial [candidate division Zixibacteria bacterium]|nr:hypothetical protein [candidate division Zixibacteria bacterium]